jgi:hypothetical protein
LRPHRVFLGQHRSASAGNIYTDLASAVSGSAIADDVDGTLFGVFFGRSPYRTKKQFFFRAQSVF